MKKRIKKKHCMYGEVYLKSYDRQYGLPFAWFELCDKIRNDLGHRIGKRRYKLLQRYFRRKYYRSEKQIRSFWNNHGFKLEDCETPDVFYGMMVDTIVTEREQYEDAMVLDYLQERYD
jgi:hypothetical protein